MCDMVWCYMWCHAVRWGVVKCGDTMWNDGVVHVEYGGVLWCKIMRNVVMEYWVIWFDAILDMVVWLHFNYHSASVGNVCCALERAPCNLYLNGVPRCGDLMWIMVRSEMWCVMSVCEMSVVRCGMLQFQTWCDWNAKQVCDVEYGVVWNVVSWYVECCIMQDWCR